MAVTCCNDEKNRNKFNVILADAIEPKLPAAQYLDGEDFENELKQVLGTIQSVYDLDEDTVLLCGANGTLIAGTNAKFYEPSILAYLSLMSLQIFVTQFFARVFMVSDDLQRIRELILDYQVRTSSVWPWLCGMPSMLSLSLSLSLPHVRPWRTPDGPQRDTHHSTDALGYHEVARHPGRDAPAPCGFPRAIGPPRGGYRARSASAGSARAVREPM